MKRLKSCTYLPGTLYLQSLAFRTLPIPGIDVLRNSRADTLQRVIPLKSSPLSGFPPAPARSRPPLPPPRIMAPARRPRAGPRHPLPLGPHSRSRGRLPGARRRRDRKLGLHRHPLGRERVERRAVNAPPKLPAKISEATAERCPAIVSHAGEDSTISRGRSRTGYSRRSSGSPCPPIPANSASASAISRR
jgi:hypothetical protein